MVASANLRGQALSHIQRGTIHCGRLWQLPVPEPGGSGRARRLGPVASPDCDAPVWPCASPHSVGIPKSSFAGQTGPVPFPVDASMPPSRPPPHDRGPAWFARPSPYETFIHTTKPVLTGAPAVPMSLPMAWSQLRRHTAQQSSVYGSVIIGRVEAGRRRQRIDRVPATRLHPKPGQQVPRDTEGMSRIQAVRSERRQMSRLQV